ncbi:MAG: MFS transporter [Pseudomonas oryzihabitans]|jgi:ACS family glucarate transporter-like MFS transporter|uniref:MFS transporter n=1 Tax=Pseudomonas oryzihabitans TaxID=47885 RepID=UPI0015E3F16B|nr:MULTISPECIES: MFS transporter [Pseudomonas]MBA1258062.1 MFS transporter [Pseudomonas psychrotolerans]MDU4056608.1 MFS transporter [Pseudomonas oryzihabitans]
MRNPTAPSRRTHVRYLVLAMIFLVTVFNYVDRATLSIAAPAMRHDLGFDAVAMGLAFSAFGWAYTAMQIPGGIVLDRFGSRLVLGASLILWSALTFLQGYVEFFSSALLALFVLRFLMGVAESPAFPANNRLTVMWFPRQERGLATAIFQSAQYFALAVFTPLMVILLNQFGWEHVFFWTGGAGILIGLLWFATVQEPRHDKRVSQSELDHIEAGGGLPDLGDTRAPFSWRTFKAISGNRMMLGIYLGQFCLTTITWFFLTWFPTYLVEAKGLTMLKVGLIAAIPPVAGCLGGVLGGLWSDGMLRRGYSLTAARKTPIIVGLLLSSSIVVANYTQSIALVTLVMSIAFFAKGVGNLGWCIVGDVSPKRAMGVSGAIFNFCGNIASIVTPLAIGLMINQLGSFDVALTYVAAMGLLGAFSYLVIVGPLKRLDLGELNDEPSATTDTALPATRP